MTPEKARRPLRRALAKWPRSETGRRARGRGHKGEGGQRLHVDALFDDFLDRHARKNLRRADEVERVFNNTSGRASEANRSTIYGAATWWRCWMSLRMRTVRSWPTGPLRT